MYINLAGFRNGSLRLRWSTVVRQYHLHWNFPNENLIGYSYLVSLGASNHSSGTQVLVDDFAQLIVRRVMKFKDGWPSPTLKDVLE